MFHSSSSCWLGKPVKNPRYGSLRSPLFVNANNRFLIQRQSKVPKIEARLSSPAQCPQHSLSLYFSSLPFPSRLLDPWMLYLSPTNLPLLGQKMHCWWSGFCQRPQSPISATLCLKPPFCFRYCCWQEFLSSVGCAWQDAHWLVFSKVSNLIGF